MSHTATSSESFETKVGQQAAYESVHNSNSDEMMREINHYRAHHSANETEKVVKAANDYISNYNKNRSSNEQFPKIDVVTQNGEVTGFNVGNDHYGKSYKDKSAITTTDNAVTYKPDGTKVETKGETVTTTGGKGETIDNKDYDKAFWNNATKNVTVTDNDGKVHIQRFGDNGLLWSSNTYSIDVDKQTGKVTGEYTDALGSHNKMNFDSFSDYVKDLQKNNRTDEMQLLYNSGKLSPELQSQLKAALAN
jgi:hypothetical protein